MKLSLCNLKKYSFINIFSKNLRLDRYFTNKKSYKVLFFGSDYIGLKCLQKIIDLRKTDTVIRQIDLVTTNTAKNRSLLEKYADSEKLQRLSWPLSKLQKGEYDVGLIVAFGHLIHKDVLDKFPLGIINVHPSLLPRWRGAAPIIHTLLHGDEVTGVSLMKIKADQFDVGDIISQKTLEVPNDVTLPTLTARLSDMSADMLVACMKDLPAALANARPQRTEGVTYAKKVDKSISEINWKEMTSNEVYNLYRALFGLYDLTSKFQGKRIKFYDAFLPNSLTTMSEGFYGNEEKPVGTIEYCEKNIALKILCRDKKYICFRLVKIGTKNKRITALDFYNGYVKNVEIERRNNVLGT